ncbi:MAG: tetratricopeptide repeat protein [Planctomycetota bacterium]
MAKRRRGRSNVRVTPSRKNRSLNNRTKAFGIGVALLVAVAIAAGLLLRGNRSTPTRPTPPPTPVVVTTLEPFHFGVDPNDSALSPEEKDRALRQEQIDIAQRLVETLPQNANARFVLAMAYQEQGNSPQATQYLHQCLDLEPTRADAYDQLGRIAREEGRHQDAVNHFLKAEQYNPKLAGLYYRLGQAYRSWDKPDEAIAAMAKSAELFPQAPESYVALGELYLQKQDYGAARQNYEAAIERDPNQSKPYYGLATACARLKQKEQAAAYRQKFKEVEAKQRDLARRQRAAFDPLQVTCGSVAHTHTDVARVLNANQQACLAEQLWQRAVRLDPNNVTCRFNLADYYLRLKRFDEALPWYLQVTRLQPDNGPAYFFLGHVYEELGRRADAQDAYETVIKVSPDRPEGFLALARFLWEGNKDLSRTRELVQRAVDLAPIAANYAFLSRVCLKTGDRQAALAAAQQAIQLAPRNPEYRRLLQQAQRN